MDGESDFHWFAIYTKPKQEPLAAANVERLGLEVLFPKIKAEQDLWGVPHMVCKALFSRYVFARFCPQGHLNAIRYAHGVHSIVSAGSTPLPVREEIVESIRSRIREDGCVELQSMDLQPGDPVVIKEGPLKGWIGIFERRLSDQERVQILLHTLDYQGRAFLHRFCLERVN